jgi:ferric-dicitrate binding protein FerR (iron transport regulator)
MNEHEQDHEQTGDADDLGELLRAVGPREQPPAEVAAEVRAAVAAEWRAAVAARQAIRQAAPLVAQPAARRVVRPWMALAASVAVVAIAVGIALPRWHGSGDPMGTVARVSGTAEIRHAADSAWQPLVTGANVSASDEIRTRASGRVAVRRTDGLEVRLDEATQLAFDDAGRASLASGSVYVDAGAPGSGRDGFVIGTSNGDVRHLGTQYVASVRDGLLQVAVREGSVAVDKGQTPVMARAGESLTIARDGAVSRSQFDVYGDAWRWVESVAPEFVIDGRSLDEFLAWAGRETGRKIVYTSADAAREAETTRLRGSIAGLTPEAAVAAVFASEPGLRQQIAGGQIRVERTDR